jgi:hypothetical protein
MELFCALREARHFAVHIQIFVKCPWPAFWLDHVQGRDH